MKILEFLQDAYDPVLKINAWSEGKKYKVLFEDDSVYIVENDTNNQHFGIEKSLENVLFIIKLEEDKENESYES